MIGTIKNIVATTLVLVISLTQTSYAIAQVSPDTRSPVIELEAVAESQADSQQVFTAQVVDNRELKDVILYHRRDGQQAFTPVPMNPIGATAYFTAAIETDPSDLRAIQYYVQARDEGGNRTVQGYAFDPYTRVLTAPAATVVAKAPTVVEAPTQTDSAASGIQWWQVALGVVLVGAIASAAGGGGDSGATDDGKVPLTVTVTGLQ